MSTPQRKSDITSILTSANHVPNGTKLRRSRAVNRNLRQEEKTRVLEFQIRSVFYNTQENHRSTWKTGTKTVHLTRCSIERI